MKRYLTLLTISFLSTSTLAKAGFDIFDPPTNPSGRAGSLRAKADRLQKNIGNTQNEGLIKAFTTQRDFINRHLNTPLNERDSNAYFEIKDQKYNIKHTFVAEVRNEMHEQQFNKIYSIVRSKIYAPESQEFKDLDAALQFVRQIKSDRYVGIGPIKAAGRYLKMEKLIAPHIQKAEKTIEKEMAEAKKIKASGVKRDLEILIRRLDYGDEFKTVGQALNLLEQIDRENEYSEYLTENILSYKALEDKLKPLLTPFRQSKQETPSFIASVLAGASDYAKLEEGLSSRYSYQYDTPKEVEEFLSIMKEIRVLPLLLTRLKELRPKAQELLDNPLLGDETSNFKQMDVDLGSYSDSDSESSDSSSHNDEVSHQPNSARRVPMPIEDSPKVKPEVIRPSVKLNPVSFAIVRDDIKGRGLTTPFSFKSPQEGSFEVTGEGTLFYQLLPKPLMDTLVGQRFLLEAEIKTETPGGYLQYFNGNERVMSDPYPGGNSWRKLQLKFIVKDGSRYHIVYPLVMPPQAPGSKIPVVEIRNINLNFAS
ncbi:MAG: hypothetical protein K2Y08_04960 [Alphaproteobacteria bacterium]|nr:hypothetical protein [Alphaproteobacteria bacterium]